LIRFKESLNNEFDGKNVNICIIISIHYLFIYLNQFMTK